jgi:hypothetical protein
MKRGSIHIIFYCGFLIFSCTKTESGSGGIQISQNTGEKTSSPLLSTQSILDAHKNILQLVKQYEDTLSRKEYYIKKINIDIPDGEAWLIVWGWGNIEAVKDSSFIKVYIFKDGQIIKDYDPDIRVYNMNQYVSFDIMKDIPGERIGQGMAAIYDFNHDGFDEIVSLEFSGMGRYFAILGYDKYEDTFIDYTPELRFRLDDAVNGPAPVKYMEYNGYWGFLIDEDKEYNVQSFWFYYPENRQYYSWNYPLKEEDTAQ